MTLSDEDIKYIESIIDQRVSSISASKPKKERKKSEWQIFLGPCIKSQPREKGMGEKIKECSVEYKKAKSSINKEK